MIKELLEEEIKKSGRFTKENFGQQVGSDYPELVREVCKSEDVSLDLMLHLLLTNISAREMGEKIKELKGPKEFDQVVLSFPDVFKTPFSMLYWGINIGRKLAHDEAKMFKSFEGEDNGKD